MTTLLVLIPIFAILAIFVIDRVVSHKVFGPYIDNNGGYGEEIRSMLIHDRFELSRDEWNNGMLHTEYEYDGEIEYLAFHSEGFTSPNFYAISVIENGERQSYRVKGGTTLFNKIREHHENLKKERKHEAL